MVAITVVVSKTVDTLWGRCRRSGWADFTRFHAKICGHSAAQCTNSGSSKVGATREMTAFGRLLKETLISFVDPPNSYSYDMLGPFGPLELDSYNATVALLFREGCRGHQSHNQGRDELDRPRYTSDARRGSGAVGDQRE